MQNNFEDDFRLISSGNERFPYSISDHGLVKAEPLIQLVKLNPGGVEACIRI